MYKPLRQIVLITVCAAALLPQSAVHAHDHPVVDLLDLPHPMRVLNRAHWQEHLSSEQKAAIAVLRSEIQPRFLALTAEAIPLQEQLHAAVFAHDTAAPSREALQALADLRLRMTEVQAGAYTRLKSVLGAGDWEKLLQELQQN